MAIAQQHRRIAISTPLGKDVLLLRGFTGSEAISQLFHFDLDLLSENDSIKFQDVVGKNVTLRIYDADGAERHWNGFISRFSQGAQDRRLTAYRAQMVPWLWFLTRTADCRIFQNQKAPDIIQKIFKDLGFSDFKLRLYGDFVTRDYCVQYRETDFNFVSRLMEEEGICYYFEQQDGKHTLILANDPAAHEPCPNQKTARYDFRGGSVVYEDVITEWQYQEEFRPGKWTQTDYNFETPSTSLAVTASGKNPYEIYEYPGEYQVRPAGESLAKIRLQEQATPTAVFPGAGGCRYFSPGYQFTLAGSLPQRPEPGVPAHLRPPHGEPWSRLSGRWRRQRQRQRRANLSQQLRVHPVLHALPSGARHPRALRARLPDGGSRRTRRRRDLHRQVRPREGPVPLGPRRQEEREQLLLDPRLPPLGRPRLGSDLHPAHRPGSDRRFPRRRPRPAHHRRPSLQRRADAPLRNARRRRDQRHQVEQHQGRRRQQRDLAWTTPRATS